MPVMNEREVSVVFLASLFANDSVRMNCQFLISLFKSSANRGKTSEVHFAVTAFNPLTTA